MTGSSARDDDPPLPDEERQRAARSATATTVPMEAVPGAVLHVRFGDVGETDSVVRAMSEVRDLLRARPGSTRVVVHVPQGAGRPALPMELRTGVAYDAELLAEVRRRLGDGLVDLALV